MTETGRGRSVGPAPAPVFPPAEELMDMREAAALEHLIRINRAIKSLVCGLRDLSALVRDDPLGTLRLDDQLKLSPSERLDSWHSAIQGLRTASKKLCEPASLLQSFDQREMVRFGFGPKGAGTYLEARSYHRLVMKLTAVVLGDSVEGTDVDDWLTDFDSLVDLRDGATGQLVEGRMVMCARVYRGPEVIRKRVVEELTAVKKLRTPSIWKTLTDGLEDEHVEVLQKWKGHTMPSLASEENPRSASLAESSIDNFDNEEWVPISEAARETGISVDKIRRRTQRQDANNPLNSLGTSYPAKVRIAEVRKYFSRENP